MYTTESLFRCLHDKTKTLHLPLMLCAALHDIDTGRINAGVAKEVSQFRYILLQLIEDNGEQMPEVMGKDLAWFHIGGGTQFPHLLPDVGSVHGFAASCDKDRAAGDICLFVISLERFSQFLRD